MIADLNKTTSSGSVEQAAAQTKDASMTRTVMKMFTHQSHRLKNYQLTVIILLFLSATLAGNFGQAVRINEDHLSLFEGSNGIRFVDGTIHTVYYSRPNNQRHVYVNYTKIVPDYDAPDNYNIERFQLDDFPDDSFKAPVMELTPQGTLSFIYPRSSSINDRYHYPYLYWLTTDFEGNVVHQDTLQSPAYTTTKLLANDSNIHVLFKEQPDEFSLSRFHQYSEKFIGLDDVPSRILWQRGDVVHGRVHSNTDIWLAGEPWPVFYGLVTTAGQIRGPGNIPEEEVFLGGLIEFYDILDHDGTYAVRAYGSQPIGSNERDDAIAFVTVDGGAYELWLGVIITEEPDEWIEGVNLFTIYDNYPPYGLVGNEIGENRIPKVDTIWSYIHGGSASDRSLFIPMELWISGDFAGRQTWASSHDIYLKDDITYFHTTPGQSPDGLDSEGNQSFPVNYTDYLGIISEKSIYIQYGHYHPWDTTRVKPNTNDIYLYGSYAALGEGENFWEDGVFSFQYQFPKGSTPHQYWRAERFTNIDLHRFHYPTSVHDPWPPGLDYPWYNPLWPEPGQIYGFGHLETTPNPDSVATIVKLRGDINLFGSVAQNRVGYMRRSGNEDFDTGIWDIDNTLFPNTPPQYGSPSPNIGPTGYHKNYAFDTRLSHNSPPHFPGLNDFSRETLSFHYLNTDDGIEFNEVLSDRLADQNRSLNIAVHENDIAILADSALLLFRDNSNEYQEYEINIAEEKEIREMLFTEAGIFLLATERVNGDLRYLSTLYHYCLSNNMLDVVDEMQTINLIQSIVYHQDNIVWAVSNDEDTIYFFKYESQNRNPLFYSWEHNIPRPEDYCPETSKIALKSDGNQLAVAVSFRQAEQYFPGGDIYVAIGDFEFTAIEQDEEQEGVFPELAITHFPNPINRNDLLNGQGMNINFSLSANCKVEIDLYNIRGQHIKRLTAGEYLPGNHNLYWDGRDKGGNTVSSGVYFYRMQTGNEELSSKMLIVK